jgi:hypothetical protein
MAFLPVDAIFAGWPTIGSERYQLAGKRVVRLGHSSHAG